MKEQLRECIRQIEESIKDHVNLPDGSKPEELHQRCLEALRCLQMTWPVWLLAGCATAYRDMIDYILSAWQENQLNAKPSKRLDTLADVMIECMVWELAQALDQSRK